MREVKSAGVCIRLIFLCQSMQKKLPVASPLYRHVFVGSCQWQVLEIAMYLKKLHKAVTGYTYNSSDR